MEQRYILFRSHKIHNTYSGSNILTHRGRGSDFSEIEPYIVWDDTRDISWQHSARTPGIQKKIRMEYDTFPIHITQTVPDTHWFYTEDGSKSAFEYANTIKDTILTSAKKYHYKTKISQIKELQHTKNSMIFYITSTLDAQDLEQIYGISRNNDLIVLHIFHPYELNPTSWFLFDGLWINPTSYKKEFENKQKNIKKLIEGIGAGYILLTADMTAVPYLNQFFKNRY